MTGVGELAPPWDPSLRVDRIGELKPPSTWNPTTWKGGGGLAPLPPAKQMPSAIRAVGRQEEICAHLESAWDLVPVARMAEETSSMECRSSTFTCELVRGWEGPRIESAR